MALAEQQRTFIATHYGLAWTIARQYSFGDVDNDIAQAARYGLCLAAVGYDPKRGAFSTFAYPAMRWEILKVLKDKRQHTALSLDAPAGREEIEAWVNWLPADEPLPDDDCASAEIRRAIRAAIERLKPKARAIVEQYFGLDGKPGRTFEQIGGEIGLTKQRVHTLFANAMARLRYNQYLREVAA